MVVRNWPVNAIVACLLREENPLARFRPVIDRESRRLAETEAYGIEVHLRGEHAAGQVGLIHFHPHWQDPWCGGRKNGIERGVGFARHGERVVVANRRLAHPR